MVNLGGSRLYRFSLDYIGLHPFSVDYIDFDRISSVLNQVFRKFEIM